MLNSFRTWLGLQGQAAVSSLAFFLKKPVSTLLIVLVIAMTLVLPSLFWVLTDHMKEWTATWQQGGRIALYLKPALTSKEEAQVLSQVTATVGVSKATLKTPAEGLLLLQKQEGMQDVMRYLSSNPLPAMIDVLPTVETNTVEKVQHLYLTLKSYSGVLEAKLDFAWINRFQAIVQVLTAVARGLGLLLALAVVLIIGNTLRLMVHNIRGTNDSLL